MQLPQSWTLNWNWKGIFRGSPLHIYFRHYTQDGPTLSELAILKACPALCPWVTLSLLSPNFTMSASSCFYTDSCVSLQQLWRYSSTEWARSWVQPQDCKNKTTNTTAQQRTHKAFPKSQLMSSPSLVPPYFTLSLYIIPTLPLQLQSIIESQLEAQCSFILVFPLPGSSQHRGLQMTLYEYEWTVILF